MQKIKIPEKEWFTFGEIAARWEVDVATVAHYVWDLHLLRPAFVRKDINLCELTGFIGGEDASNKKLTSYGIYFSANKIDGSKYKGDFLYIDTNMDCDHEVDANLFYKFKYQINMLPEPFNAAEYDAKNSVYFYNPTGGFVSDFNGEKIFVTVDISLGINLLHEPCILAVPLCNKYFITREERDRFESKYSESEVKITGKAQEENTLYAVGVMALLLAEKSSQLRVKDRPNAEQISKAVNEAADRYGLPDAALKSLHKKIAEGLKLVNKASI